MHIGSSSVFWLGSVALLVATSFPVAAQMQIPNPLIRPRSLNNPAPNDVPPLPSGAPQRSGAATSPSASAGSAIQFEDPTAKELSELKERFSAFYVSAIVGKQAVLRRSQALRNTTGLGGITTQATGTSMAPVPLATAAPSYQVRNEALMLMDGESFEATGNVGNLVARISNRQVVIYHTPDNAGLMTGAKQSGRRTIIFVGELETSGNPTQPPIVLERPDATYKRVISVETKTRSASAQPADPLNAGNQNPSPLPPPLQ